MKLLLVRHAAAVPSGTPGVPDDERPLTSEGAAKFRVAAKGLARIARRPDVLLTSPLLRARATADIAAQAFKRIEPTVEPALAHGSVDQILTAPAALARRDGRARRPRAHAVDGPGAALGAVDGERLAFGQGWRRARGPCPRALGGGRLVWFLKPKVLERSRGRLAPVAGVAARGIP